MENISELAKNKDLVFLQSVFGEDAQIFRNSESTLVESTLTDAITRGGQRVKAKISKEQIIPTPETKDLKGNNVILRGYRVENLSINNSELVRSDEQIFLFSIPDEEKEDVSSDDLYLKLFPGAYTLENGSILLTKFDNSDDLAALLHERGHSSDLETIQTVKNLRIKLTDLDHVAGKEATYNFLTRKNMSNEPQYTPEELELFEKFLIEERVASEKAIKEAEANSNLFPDDEGLFRLKKYLTTALMTYLDLHFRLSGAIRGRANDLINLS